MVQDNTDFEDESFDLDELEDNSDASVIFLHDGTKIKQSNSISVKKYDFTNPIVLSDKDLGQLKIKSQEFTHHLSGHLSMFLRTEFNLELEDLTADLYSNFTNSINTPSCVTLFKLQ